MRMRLEDKKRSIQPAGFHGEFSRQEKKIDQEDNLQWAVSYSDLLMVLLSFFIVYFQFDDLKGINGTFLGKIAKGTNPAGGSEQRTGVAGSGTIVEGVVPSARSGTSTSPGQNVVLAPEGTTAETVEVQSVDEELARFCAQLIQPSRCRPATGANAVILELSNDIYRLGEFELNAAVKQALQPILKTFKDAKRSVNITVIGNTDQASLMQQTQNSLGSNVALASLRAAKAANYLMTKGIDEKYIFVQGANSVSRNSRSLSLVISYPIKSAGD